MPPGFVTDSGICSRCCFACCPFRNRSDKRSSLDSGRVCHACRPHSDGSGICVFGYEFSSGRYRMISTGAHLFHDVGIVRALLPVFDGALCIPGGDPGYTRADVTTSVLEEPIGSAWICAKQLGRSFSGGRSLKKATQSILYDSSTSVRILPSIPKSPGTPSL